MNVISMKAFRYLTIFLLLAFSIGIASAQSYNVTTTSTAHSSYVNVLEPYNITIYNNSILYLGRDGPGQSFYITISSQTVNSTGASFPLGWNELLASDVPSGWIAENSALYNRQLSVRITPAPNTPNGTYSFNLSAVNVGNYSKLGTARFRVFINITTKVFNTEVGPKTIIAGPGEPEDVNINITNTGVSDVPFEISAYGLPEWNLTQTVIAPHNTSRDFVYPIYVYEPGSYQVRVHVFSEASNLIYQDTNITLVAAPSLLNDYSAIGKGTLAFPIVYEPAYAVMYLISRFVNAVK